MIEINLLRRRQRVEMKGRALSGAAILLLTIPMWTVLGAMVTAANDIEMYLGVAGTLVWLVMVGWAFVQIGRAVRTLIIEKTTP